jgi:hypothetical protein
MTRVCTLVDLSILALQKRAVWVPDSPAWRKHVPARFVLNLPGQVILNMVRMGMFVYEPKPKQEGKGEKHGSREK